MITNPDKLKASRARKLRSSRPKKNKTLRRVRGELSTPNRRIGQSGIFFWKKNTNQPKHYVKLTGYFPHFPTSKYYPA